MYILKGKAKTLIICGLLICFYAASEAQDYYGGGGSWRKRPSQQQNQPKEKEDEGIPEPSGYISVNFGFATPKGSFGQAFPQGNYTEAVGTGYGNYATPGDVFSFSLGIPINHSNFGIALMFGSYDNSYDLGNYVNGLSNSSFYYNPYSNSPIIGYAAAPAQNSYSESSILGGLFATYPIGRLSFDGRFMIGALLCGLPEQNVYAEDADGDQLQYDVEPSNATSFAIDVGVGARFLLAQLGRRKLCIMANVDYLYSNVSYSTQQDLYVVPNSGPNAGYQAQLVPSPSVSGKLPIQLLNVTFGIGYQLN